MDDDQEGVLGGCDHGYYGKLVISGLIEGIEPVYLVLFFGLSCFGKRGVELFSSLIQIR